jgi:hypothetical protein
MDVEGSLPNPEKEEGIQDKPGTAAVAVKLRVNNLLSLSLTHILAAMTSPDGLIEY